MRCVSDVKWTEAALDVLGRLTCHTGLYEAADGVASFPAPIWSSKGAGLAALPIEATLAACVFGV